MPPIREDGKNQYQIAGLDERQRGFNRLAKINRGQGVYQAILQYESSRFKTPECETEKDALNHLIRDLHEEGYRQLRSQLTFRGNAYLGSQHEWIEYPDPEIFPERLRGFWGWLKNFLKT